MELAPSSALGLTAQILTTDKNVLSLIKILWIPLINNVIINIKLNWD